MAVDLAEGPTKLREVDRTDYSYRLDKSDLPWLDAESHQVSLVRMRVGASVFLFGSAINSKRLVDAASELDEHRSEITNNLLYTHLPQFAEGYNPHVTMLENSSTRLPIFYVKNNGGQRVYFMRFGRLDNMPIIIRIAACDKASQTEVLSTLTTMSRRMVRQLSK